MASAAVRDLEKVEPVGFVISGLGRRFGSVDGSWLRARAPQ